MGKTLVLLFVAWSWGADAADAQSVFEPVASEWLVESILEFPLYSFYFGPPSVKGVAYLPNFAPRLGPRVSYRNFGAAVTLSLPIPPEERTRRGDTRQDSVIVNSYWREAAFDLYHQSYRGFYIASPWTELSVRRPARYPQIPDARISNSGINVYYLLESGRYSLKAAFDLNEYQMGSGGSWVMQGFYNRLEMDLGSGFVPGSQTGDLPSLPNLERGRFDTAGAGLGYGYMHLFGGYFLSGQGVAGLGLQSQRLRPVNGAASSAVSLAAKMNLNAAVGWNRVRSVGGVKLLVDSIWTRVQNTQVTSSLISGQVFFGLRF